MVFKRLELSPRNWLLCWDGFKLCACLPKADPIYDVVTLTLYTNSLVLVAKSRISAASAIGLATWWLYFLHDFYWVNINTCLTHSDKLLPPLHHQEGEIACKRVSPDTSAISTTHSHLSSQGRVKIKMKLSAWWMKHYGNTTHAGVEVEFQEFLTSAQNEGYLSDLSLLEYVARQ